MPRSIDTQQNVIRYIDDALKSSVDSIVFDLESEFDYTLSPSTILSLVLLTTEFSTRFTDTVNSQDLLEPENFDLGEFK